MFLGWKLIVVAIAGVFAGAAGIANALWGPRARARQRLARGTAKIGDREIVTVVGKVRPLEELEAPLSGRTCVAFESIARIYDGRNYLGQVVERAMVNFELETADGLVRVEGEQAEVALDPSPLIPRKIEREAKFLASHSRSPEYARGAGFDEVVIQEGDKVAVQGMAVLEQSPEGERGYRDAPLRVRIVAHPEHPLTIGKA